MKILNTKYLLLTVKGGLEDQPKETPPNGPPRY